MIEAETQAFLRQNVCELKTLISNRRETFNLQETFIRTSESTGWGNQWLSNQSTFLAYCIVANPITGCTRTYLLMHLGMRTNPLAQIIHIHARDRLNSTLKPFWRSIFVNCPALRSANMLYKVNVVLLQNHVPGG